MSLSVVIPSRSIDNLVPCVEALRRHEPGIRVVVIDDGLDLSECYDVSPCQDDFETRVHSSGVLFERIPGKPRFCFAANCNIGIEHAGGDVVLLNDDAILETPRGFTAMQRAGQEHPEYGVISAVCPDAQPEQRPQSIGLRPVARMVAFYAVLIPRRTIETVGLLDERFTAYGHEDDDYCLRVRQAELKIGAFDGCAVQHGKTENSTFRSDPEITNKYMEGRYQFRLKWGVYAELA